MKAVAFIPARGGSKRVPGKNLREVGGVSLVERAVWAALGADIDAVVSTDDDEVSKRVAGLATLNVNAGRGSHVGTVKNVCRIHERPTQLATDHAQIETAIAHWWTRLDDKPDAIVLLQPTSPFRTAAHVREALWLLDVTGADSVVGVTVGHEHHFAGRLKPREVYGEAADGRSFEWFDWQPFRDPSETRPRTQDLPPRGHETGSIYVSRRSAWEASGLRMSGHIVALPMTRVEGWDVDTEEDLAICNALVTAGVCK